MIIARQHGDSPVATVCCKISVNPFLYILSNRTRQCLKIQSLNLGKAKLNISLFQIKQSYSLHVYFLST